MILKWSDYLAAHPSNQDYNTNTAALQTLIPKTEKPENAFRHFHDNKSLVCITRSAFDGNIQATFNHSIRKSSFTQPIPDFLALTGFGARATSVKMDPKEIFKHPKKQVNTPTFADLLKCKTVEDLKNLKVVQSKMTLDSYALLPPILAAELFDEEDWAPSNILLKLVRKINDLHPAKEPEVVELDQDDKSENETSEPTNESQDGSSEQKEDGKTSKKRTKEEHPLEESFSRIMIFLYLATMNEAVVEGTKLMVCSKRSTEEWSEQQHMLCLQRKDRTSERQTTVQLQPNQQLNSNELVILSSKFGALTQAMTDKTLFDMQEKAEKAGGEGKFKKLPPMHRNTITLFTMVPEMTQEELLEIKPTETFISILGMTSGATVRDTLHHMMKAKGHMVCLQDGMCAGLKNGAIHSTDIFDINGITPFHCGPEPCGKQITNEQRAVLEETAALGKMQKSDIELLTKSENYLPKDFWAYEHQIRNFLLLCQILGGKDCLTARAWLKTVEHAQRNQALYKRIEKECSFFYTSLLDDFHRRTQSFIHSCAHGMISELKLKQLDFAPILEEIENHKYYARKPMWMPKENNKRKAPQALPGAGGPGGSGITPGGQRRLFNNQERGDIVYNQNLHEDMKVLSPATYHKVFAPEFLKGVQRCNHPDGSEKCNNFHHRGRCHSKCPRIASHEKKLTAKEIECGKAFVLEVFGKWSANEGNKDGVIVPPGHPPTTEKNNGNNGTGKK